MLVDWSNLPLDIILKVAENFVTLEDMIAFSAVCRDWAHVFSILKKTWTPRLPWIMLAEPGEDHAKIEKCIDLYDGCCSRDLIIDNLHPCDANPEYIRNLFDPLLSKVYPLKLVETFGRRCFGSPYGWLFTIGLDLEIHLFNPITKSQLNLPPQWTMPNQPVVDGKVVIDPSFHCDRVWVRTCFVKKAIVLKLPPSQDEENIIVFALYGEQDFLAFTRPGDLEWTEVKMQRVYDVVFWKGMFLILGLDGVVQYFDRVALGSKLRVVTPKVYNSVLSDNLEHVHLEMERYLLEARDVIYMIVRIRSTVEDIEDENEEIERKQANSDDDSHWYERTQSFNVFKLNTVCGTWDEVEDLDNMTFFVGNCCTMHIDNVSLTKFPPNSIWFMDDSYEYYGASRRAAGGHDAGVYDFKNKEMLKPFYVGEDAYSRYCCPLFFTPTLI